jgi:uncharacterized protein YbjT (DUF2867 family)
VTDPPSNARGVLVAGATGFVGRALVQRLILRGVRPRVTTRHPEAAVRLFGDRVQVASADWVTGRGTDAVAEGIRVAYYLVHSMGSRPDYAEAGRAAAARFAAQMARAGVERIV